ncbi:MAG TPA: hypothetical protein VGM63_02500 [Mucilaginibacter sp.]|jgi:hypothetical protein
MKLAKNVKILFTLGLTIFSFQLFAQQLRGIVLDKNTLLPIPHTTVSTSSQIVSTSFTGLFTLTKIHKNDTVRISCVGYKPHYLVFEKPLSDTIRIYLEPNVTALKSVVIIGKRDPKADSLKFRKDFAQVFDYKAPTFKDAFITRDPNVYKWNDFITSTNNATTILSLNLLSVLDLLNKNNAPVSKLQKTLVREEQYNYVSTVFSKQKVTEITHLKGDSLQTFMDKYRPSVADAKTMTDYEVMIYIKKCYREFTEPEELKK